jgi:hypothetical protein
MTGNALVTEGILVATTNVLSALSWTACMLAAI